MKESYDKNSVKRSFQVGDKVLAFLPVTGAPLHAMYFGQYVVEKKENELNCVIVTHNRRKSKQLCHVNMLKLHYERRKQSSVLMQLAQEVLLLMQLKSYENFLTYLRQLN